MFWDVCAGMLKTGVCVNCECYAAEVLTMLMFDSSFLTSIYNVMALVIALYIANSVRTCLASDLVCPRVVSQALLFLAAR